MNILVIGAKGFIGSHLLEYYKNSGHRVWGCDIAGNDPEIILINHPETDYEKIFSEIKPDICFNCAGAASVPLSIENPAKDFYQNVYTTVLILEAIKKQCSSCKFILLSSAAVYGNPENLPVSETSVLKPLSPYGLHKKQAEEISLEYNRFFDLKVCIVRIFSAYGEGLKKQLFWDLFQKTKHENKIELHGTGKETRDFIYISDLVNALVLIAGNHHFDGSVVNVANGVQVSVNEAVTAFANASGFKGEIVFSGRQRSGDPQFWQADISGLAGMGYKRSTGFEDGIKKYVSWLKQAE